MGAVPTFPSKAASSVLTAADWNAAKAAYDFLTTKPESYAYHSTTQSIPNNTYTLVQLDSEVYDVVQSGDTEGHVPATNSRLYCRTPGKYEIGGQYQAASNATGYRAVQVRLNAGGNPASGTLLAVNQQGAVSGVSTSVTLPTVKWPLVAGDYIEMFVIQTSGGALNTVAGVGVTFLRMSWASV